MSSLTIRTWNVQRLRWDVTGVPHFLQEIEFSDEFSVRDFVIYVRDGTTTAPRFQYLCCRVFAAPADQEHLGRISTHNGK